VSSPLRLRAGIDPLVDPRDIADLAAALMSPRDRLLIFLVDRSLVGSLTVAVDLERDRIADLFAIVHDATLGTDLRGLVLAERATSPLDLSDPIVTEVLAAPCHGLRIDAWVRFGASSAYDVWPLVGPGATS
jgi:hypothetical protein